MAGMKDRTLIILDCIIMAHHAVIMLMLGPLVPEIMAAYKIGEGTAGLMLSAGSLGFMLGPLIAGIGIDRMGVKKAVLIGYSAEFVLLIFFGFSPFFWLSVLINFFLITASGFLETSANVIPSLLKNRNPVSLLNLVHFFFSVGAFAAPLLIGSFIARGGSWQTVFLAAAVPTLALGITFSLFKFTHVQEVQSKAQALQTPFSKLLKNRAVVFGALSLFFFMGAELGFSSWAVYYLEKKLYFTKIQASLGLSLFWIGIMAGRLANAALARKYTSFILVVLSSALSVICGIPFLFARSIPVVYPLLFLIGVSMAGGYPNALGEINRRFPGKTGVVTGILSFGAGAGAMVFQWLLGITAEQAGLTQAMAIPPVLMALMAVVFWAAVGKQGILRKTEPTDRAKVNPNS